MSDTKTLTPMEAIEAELKAAGAIAELAENEGRDLTDDERGKVMAHLGKARSKRAEAALEAEVKAFGDLGAMLSPEPGAAIANRQFGAPAGKSIGQAFVEAEAWTGYLKSVTPSGGNIPKDVRIHGPALDLGGLKGLGYGQKDLVTGASATSAGALVQNDWLGLMDSGIYARPLTVLDVISRGTTGSDTVEYARENTVTNNAAVVPEAAQVAHVGDEAATKPESVYTLQVIQEPVKTIAHWIPATKRALSDASQVRSLIDAFLTYGLREVLEDQIITGDGVGDNFTGLLNVTGVQSQAWFNGTGTNGDEANLLWTMRKAKTKVKTVGRATPNAYMLHPNDSERLDLITDGNDRFYFDGPRADGPQTVWRLPVVESEAVPEGQGICGDWRRLMLWDREQAAIMATDSHADFFIRNLVAILAELRAAFGVIRPAAFVVMDLTAA